MLRTIMVAWIVILAGIALTFAYPGCGSGSGDTDGTGWSDGGTTWTNTGTGTTGSTNTNTYTPPPKGWGGLPAGTESGTTQELLTGILAGINAYRADNGLAALETADAVCGVAADYAEVVASFDLYEAGLDGKTPQVRLSEAGVSFATAGEAGFWMDVEDADAAVDVLLGAYGELLANPEFTKIGISVIEDGETEVCVINLIG